MSGDQWKRQMGFCRVCERPARVSVPHKQTSITNSCVGDSSELRWENWGQPEAATPPHRPLHTQPVGCFDALQNYLSMLVRLPCSSLKIVFLASRALSDTSGYYPQLLLALQMKGLSNRAVFYFQTGCKCDSTTESQFAGLLLLYVVQRWRLTVYLFYFHAPQRR